MAIAVCRDVFSRIIAVSLALMFAELSYAFAKVASYKMVSVLPLPSAVQTMYCAAITLTLWGALRGLTQLRNWDIMLAPVETCVPDVAIDVVLVASASMAGTRVMLKRQNCHATLWRDTFTFFQASILLAWAWFVRPLHDTLLIFGAAANMASLIWKLILGRCHSEDSLLPNISGTATPPESICSNTFVGADDFRLGSIMSCNTCRQDGSSSLQCCSQCPCADGSTSLPEDAPPWHEAHRHVKYNGTHANPLVYFRFYRAGHSTRFQTTVAAAGSRHAAEVIARACWMKFEEGLSKSDVLGFRNECYARLRQATRISEQN